MRWCRSKQPLQHPGQKLQGLGFRDLGFRGLGSRVLGFRVEGLARVLGHCSREYLHAVGFVCTGLS